MTLTPTFDDETTAYTATTTNATDKITATADDGIDIAIKVNGSTVANEGDATWVDGENTVKITASGTDLTSTEYTVTVTYEEPQVAKLASLSIGSLTLDPTFDADVTTYTASTENNTNTIKATGADGVSVSIKNGDTDVESGTAATWEDGENTVTIVASGSGMTSTTYTVTVTKS